MLRAVWMGDKQTFDQSWTWTKDNLQHKTTDHLFSWLFGKQAEWLIYHEVLLTAHEYMRRTTGIEPRWLVEAAPTDKLSKRNKAERI